MKDIDKFLTPRNTLANGSCRASLSLTVLYTKKLGKLIFIAILHSMNKYRPNYPPDYVLADGLTDSQRFFRDRTDLSLWSVSVCLDIKLTLLVPGVSLELFASHLLSRMGLLFGQLGWP